MRNACKSAGGVIRRGSATNSGQTCTQPSVSATARMSSKKRTDDRCGAHLRVDNSVVDTAGARALAQRIAEGRPPADTFLEPTPPQTPSSKRAGDGVVYIRPRAVRAAGEVRMFVRGPDGRLHRSG